jgi:hypothetical protein
MISKKINISLLVVGILFLLIGFAGLLHQYFTIGVWFQFDDMNHEALTIMAKSLSSYSKTARSGYKK